MPDVEAVAVLLTAAVGTAVLTLTTAVLTQLAAVPTLTGVSSQTAVAAVWTQTVMTLAAAVAIAAFAVVLVDSAQVM